MKLLEIENTATNIKFFGSRLITGTALVRNMGIYRAEVRMTQLTQFGLYSRMLGKIKGCNAMKASKYAGLRMRGPGESPKIGHFQLEIQVPVSGEMSMWPDEVTMGFYRISFPASERIQEDFISHGFDVLFDLQKAIPPDCLKQGCMVMASHMRGEQLAIGTQLPCGCTHHSIPPAVLVGFYRTVSIIRPGDYNYELDCYCEFHHGERK
jgi:hypothetical protein